MIITIDGPAGTGKSTIAKKLAEDLRFFYFDTGAMYRSFAWLAQQRKIEFTDIQAIKSLLKDFDFHMHTDEEGKKRYVVCGEDITDEIRSMQIGAIASHLSTFRQVRAKMVEVQRSIAKNKNVVFEGRDMGTVVFPEADLKIFLTASAEVRAERRYLELISKSVKPSEVAKDQIFKEIEERDRRDIFREISPLKKAEDAFLIDTSSLKIDAVLAEIKKLYLQKVSGKKKRRFFYFFIIILSRSLLKIFFRLKVYGQKHLVKGPALIAANHASYLDPPIVAVSFPEEIHFLARESLFTVPFLGTLIRNLNSHPISRQASDVKIFKEIFSLLELGDKVLLFPEGNRSKDGEIMPFKPGLGFLAWKSKCPVIPVYIKGSFRAFNRYRKWPRLFVPITCVIGSPIYSTEFEGIDKREALEKITDKTFQSIIALKKWLESGAKNSPP